MQPFADVPFSLCRYVGAKRIVTVGATADVVTSLTAGLHANCKRHGGLIVCADTDDLRLARVSKALVAARLDDYAHVRSGNVQRQLRDLDGRIDLVWLACGEDLADDVLAILAELVRPTTCVIRRGTLTAGPRPLRVRTAV